jgi:hypothetical protein
MLLMEAQPILRRPFLFPSELIVVIHAARVSSTYLLDRSIFRVSTVGDHLASTVGHINGFQTASDWQFLSTV